MDKWILCTDHRNIPKDWITHPHFRLWPPQRHRAIMRILTQLVWYMIRERNARTVQDYMDFMQRTRWKAYQHTAPFEGGKLPCNPRTCPRQRDSPMGCLLPEERNEPPGRDAMLCRGHIC
jgi:hypothetical protein